MLENELQNNNDVKDILQNKNVVKDIIDSMLLEQTEQKQSTSHISNYQSEREFSDQFLPEIYELLERRLSGHKLVKGNKREDQYNCCDLKSTTNNRLVVSVRVRRYIFYPQCFWELALTEKDNRTSELQKLMRSNASYYFYGFAHPTDIKLVGWIIYDLYKFREEIFKYMKQTGKLPGTILHKKDNNNEKFRVIDMTKFTDDILVEANYTNPTNTYII